MFDKIIQSAESQKKNILIIGSPRSGTHVLAQEISELSGASNLGEICKVGYCKNPWDDIDKLAERCALNIAHIVQLTPKITLAENIDRIKQNNIVVNIRRANKIDQFSSWVYFRVADPTGLHGWHNHSEEKTKFIPGQITAREEDIIQFKLEQLIDDYFLPDFNLKYEDLSFPTQHTYQRNSFLFPLREMFSNLEYVEQQLGSWQYSFNHFSNESK
jgi:hypothetical protein